METTIRKKVKGSTMVNLFDSSELVNIRYYKAKNNLKEEDYNENESYLYEIKIRHNEDENPEKLLANAINDIKKWKLQQNLKTLL